MDEYKEQLTLSPYAPPEAALPPVSEKIPHEALRWIAMPFASILGACLGAIALVLFLWVGAKIAGGFSEDGWYMRYILPFFSSCILGYLWGHIAAAVAPRGKVIAATVMVTILCALMIVGVTLIWVSGRAEMGAAIQTTVGAVGTIVASIVSVVHVHTERT